MKKFAAICLALVLVLSMTVIAVSATSTEFGNGTGTLNVYKKSDTEPATTGGTVTASDPTTKKSLPGAGFTVYKVMSYDGSGFSFVGPYIEDDSVKNYAASNLTLVNGETNKYVTYGDTDDLEGIISVLEGINNTETASSEVTTDENGLAQFTKLDKGVYLVKETTIPANYSASSQSFLVAILEDDQVVNAYPKNQKMEIDKNILNDDQYNTAKTSPVAGTGLDSTNLSIGDTVNYQIESQIPNYDTDAIDQMSEKNVSILKITDTLSDGLTFSDANKNDVKVFADNVDITSSVTIARTDDHNFSVEVSLDDVYSKEAPAKNYLGKKLYVIYQATLNSSAAVTTGNKNAAKLEYKNSPSDENYNLTHVTIPEDKIPVVYTYQMNLTKLLDGEAVTGDPSVTDLKFTLMQGENKVSANGSDGVYTVISDHAGAATAMSLNSTDGTLQVKGLSAGTYTLTETGSVDGYTTLQSPITIVVTDAGEGKVSAKINGTGDDLAVQTDVPNPDYDADKANAQDGDAGYDASYDKSTPETIKQSTGVFALTVNNPKSQFELPTTGGMGILLFTLGGAVVLAAAIVIFTLARKKKDTK